MGGTVAAGAALSGGARADEGDGPPVAESDRVLGPEAVRITIALNGENRTLDVEPRVTLLDLLRSSLDLTGAKKICDRGACGGCTVLLDGEPVNSCLVLAIDADGREVRTVEGLAADGALTPLQEEFVRHDALQCGFCTPGFVMSCHALLSRNPDPTEAEVRAACAGNICRCGAYSGVLAAAMAAAKRRR
ncbi:MAG: (2Fe-2S)-binding protein [Planctomycetes bacterium]|nr:(2Fe-2S)-binding protein [Planctomycetota bacterium]